ncbi:diacylglycerol kinase (ATP) [Streptomyces puniciscabiei]|uniref:Diacylglycerol kinase (ATP) n=1 Tax=Streptomyces puniciscabiei TaxID=164348 RepID=A0A542UH21_9ACTN|nr:diacylglycerol kinase family protein [Streptomyces puniciscabiei]TQK98363.1 diacylglycerol kinase (ATP) [Streptomyces puniciscabiei]
MDPVNARSSPRCLIIANPAAGQASRILADEVAERCARLGVPARTRWTAGRGDAARIAAQAVAGGSGPAPAGDDGLLVVVSLGGDGTVAETVAGLTRAASERPRPHALFVVPAGTGNSNYRAHWGDRPWQDALRAALGGPEIRPRTLDLARLAELDRFALLGAGAGLSALVLEGASGVDSSGHRRLQAGLERVVGRYEPYPGRVVVDGTVVHEGRTLFANVGGGRYRAWQFRMMPHSLLDDGLLDVCVADAAYRPADLQAELRAGRHVHSPHVVYARGREVVVERTDGAPLCFEHDGELLPRTGSRVTLAAVPRVLPVLCDPETEDGVPGRVGAEAEADAEAKAELDAEAVVPYGVEPGRAGAGPW